MRLFGLLLALAAAQGWAQAAATGAENHERRDKLRKALPDGITVLFGATDRGEENIRTGFFQEANFNYLTGWQEPGAILIVTPESDELFIPARNPERERWTGPKLGPEDPAVRQITGCDTVLAADRFESEVRRLLESHSQVYTLPGESTAQMKALAPLRPVADCSMAIARLRMIKSPEEIALIEKSIEASVAAHLAAWKMASPGLYEYQVAAAMEAVYLARGCGRSAYAPIVGSGPNSVVLHYSRNARRMDTGEVLLMDVAAECGGYAADITRTIPLGGRFSRRQKEIYEVVLGAQKAAIAAIKPGMSIGRSAPNSLYRIAYDYINTHGKDLHGQPLGKYFIHGLSHHVGLDVHDAADVSAVLEPGMVITVEPGVYIPEENLGVRIEDMVLVTRTGARVLTAALPREPAEIEKAIAK